mgnify:CR=1 FL=1
MGIYTAVPAAYAIVSIALFVLLVKLGWFGSAFLTFGPTPDYTLNTTRFDASSNVKTFCGQPIRSMRQYQALLAISCGNALLSTFYNELMRPFWFNVVNPDRATRRATLGSEMSGSMVRLFKANLESEVYLKFAHVLTLFLSLVDVWIILAQLCGSAVGSTAVICWHWKDRLKPRPAGPSSLPLIPCNTVQ